MKPILSGFTKNFRPPRIPEKNSGELLVETAGYIPTKKRIESILNAGRNLTFFRASQFDIQEVSRDSVEKAEIDKTRRKEYDYFDAHRDHQEALARFRARVLENKQRRGSVEPKGSLGPERGETKTTDPPKNEDHNTNPKDKV